MGCDNSESYGYGISYNRSYDILCNRGYGIFCNRSYGILYKRGFGILYNRFYDVKVELTKINKIVQNIKTFHKKVISELYGIKTGQSSIARSRNGESRK